MKVFLKKTIERVGLAGEVIKVEDGYARNFLFPRKLAEEVTASNEKFYATKIKTVENRKEIIATETSILAEKIGSLSLKLHKKMHDNNKLYGAIAPQEIVDLLKEQGVTVSKSQVIFPKNIKEKGEHEVIIKLSSRLQPSITVHVLPEKS